MNINITNEQIAALSPYMPNLQDILLKDDLQEFETELGGAIVEFGVGTDDEITDTGLKLQKLYDEIYMQND